MTSPQKKVKRIEQLADRNISLNLKIRNDFVSEWNVLYINNFYMNDEMLRDSYKGYG